MPDEQSMQPMQPAEPMRSRNATQAMNGSEAIGHLSTQTADVRAVEGPERNDAVVRLAGALRAADRAHRAYLAELSQGDVEPAEDWSTWYA